MEDKASRAESPQGSDVRRPKVNKEMSQGSVQIFFWLISVMNLLNEIKAIVSAPIIESLPIGLSYFYSIAMMYLKIIV